MQRLMKNVTFLVLSDRKDLDPCIQQVGSLMGPDAGL